MSRSDGGEIQKSIPWTTGLSFLPYGGSILDQPVRLMAFFEAFISGDQLAFFYQLKK